MICGDAFREGLKKTATQPFRTVPYFDPGVWGGQWMKDVCGLDKENQTSHGVLMVFQKKTLYIWKLKV